MGDRAEKSALYLMEPTEPDYLLFQTIKIFCSNEEMFKLKKFLSSETLKKEERKEVLILLNKIKDHTDSDIISILIAFHIFLEIDITSIARTFNKLKYGKKKSKLFKYLISI